jgi:hypothetical protein
VLYLALAGAAARRLREVVPAGALRAVIPPRCAATILSRESAAAVVAVLAVDRRLVTKAPNLS